MLRLDPNCSLVLASLIWGFAAVLCLLHGMPLLLSASNLSHGWLIVSALCRYIQQLHVCDAKRQKADLFSLEQAVRAAWSHRASRSDFTTAAVRCLAQTVRADSSVHSQNQPKTKQWKIYCFTLLPLSQTGIIQTAEGSQLFLFISLTGGRSGVGMYP